jgi:methylglutaconyl-CoA hydratase
MIGETTILTQIQGSVANIWLNRPERHNSLNRVMINEFLKVLRSLNADPAIRVITLQGKGPSFCAGADLLWMQQATSLTPEENHQECLDLAKCFYDLAASPKVTIALVHGAAIGGAGGFIAASDLAIATDTSRFAFSEVRLGLIPATVAPYVIRRIGHAKAMELMLTGRTFKSSEAEQIGFIHKSIPEQEFSDYAKGLIGSVLQGGQNAQEKIKTCLNALQDSKIDESLIEQTAVLIADTRTGFEATERISIFLDKRKDTSQQ